MEEGERPKSSIGDLEKSLYSRKKEQVIKRERREFKERDFGVRDEWKEIDDDEEVMKSRRPVLKMLVLASMGFFAFSAVFASFFIFRGPDISHKNVEIQIQGPALIGGGEQLALQISVANNNPVPIEAVDLIIEYPEGTRSAANVDVELPRYRESLGTINSRDQVRRNVEAVLFGEENTNKDIHVTVEYRVRDSNAIFVAESVYELALASSPLSLVVEALDETVSGQEVEFRALIKSNSSNVVRNVMLEAEYPFGFDFHDATPDPHFANKTWFLGDIPPEGEKEVIFSGTLSGQDGEERIFRFATGLQSENDENIIGAKFINISESLFIKRPFITVDLQFNEEDPTDFSIGGGRQVRGDISWVNNLPSQIFDGEIELTFKGAAVNESTIQSPNGFYRSVDDKMIWTRETSPNLGSIPPGGTGVATFLFQPYGFSSGVPLNNPIIDLDLSIKGKRLSDSNVPEEVSSTLQAQIKVSTDLLLTSKVLHRTGPFLNTGPLPPQADKETTYTVQLKVLNSTNDVSNARVVLTLPPYVEWLGIIEPLTEEISFSAVGGQIIWNLGDVAQGVGINRPSREIAFQVKMVPSITQIGKSPDLINEQMLTGFDRFTEDQVGDTRKALNLEIDEPGSNPRSESRVVE